MKKIIFPALLLLATAITATTAAAQNTKTKRMQDTPKGSRSGRSISSDTMNMRRSMNPNTNGIDSIQRYPNDSIPGNKMNKTGR